MKLTLLLLFSVLGGSSFGCASNMTEDEREEIRYERQHQLNLAIEDYQRRKAGCGTYMVFNRRGPTSRRLDATDYKMARCR